MNDVPTKGTYCARAQVLRTERLIISVEMRPPKKGELGWTVSMDADVHEALMQVLDGRGSWDEGEYGYGVHVDHDWLEVEREEWITYEIDPTTGRSNGHVKERGVYEGRHVTVMLAWEGTETGEVVLL